MLQKKSIEPLLPIEREAKILELLRKKKILRIKELHSIFSVTKMTLWRDIQNLQQKHDDIVSFHGGIMVREKGPAESEGSMEQRKEENREAKIELARRGAALVQDDETVLLDASSSSYYLALELAATKRVHIITNCIDIAHTLSGYEPVEVSVTGGDLKKETSSLAGPGAKEFLEKVRADWFFFSVSSLSGEGDLMDVNPLEIEIKLAMFESARRQALLLDSSKIGSPRGTYTVMHIDEVSRVISDSPDLDTNAKKNNFPGG